ncbi:MAG TPA: DUF6175 family protein [Myxococcota bacterium]|nr:DUF6175 family protein [Myxococcota bacterium]HRY96512.1 DUF6175 family protein [Myxococcota bacterium]
MTKKTLAIFGVLALVVASAACGGGNKEVKSDEPEVLLPGEVVESVDANIDSVRCQGKGVDQPTAMTQARKACLEWYIVEKLAQTQDQRNAYRAKQAEIFRNLDRYVKIPEVGPRDQKGEGVKSSRRIDDNTIAITIITKVFKSQLQGDLVAMGVIASKDEMLDAVGRPTLMVYPSPASKGSKYRGQVEGDLNSYLTKARWEVLSTTGQEDLNKMVDAIGETMGAEEDEAAKIAMAVGANIYLKWEAKKEGNDDEVFYSVSIEAYETTTARKLASQRSNSARHSTWAAGEELKAIISAATDAMGQILPQITGYWGEDVQKGNKFYVVFKNAPKNAHLKMNGVLKKACTYASLDRQTASEVVFRVQCKLDNIELQSAIDEGITAQLGGAEYDISSSKVSLIYKFK